jgi:hypothetical protein
MKEIPANPPLLHDMLSLADAFNEHICIIEFMLTAMPAVMGSEEAQTPEAVMGAKWCSQMLQSRTRELKHSLNQVLDRYRAEHDKADQPDY